MTGRHRGLADDDPRNAAVIALLRPEDMSKAELKARIARFAEGVRQPQTKARLLDQLAAVDSTNFAPAPPLSLPPDHPGRPSFRDGAHPDLVTRLRVMDATLPERCLWLVWGRAALVHPRSGVIFAVAIGSIGIAARLPSDLCSDAPRALAAGLSAYDVSAAGPGWCFPSGASDALWCAAAYCFAA
jgi:hypothetical protein